MAIYITERPSNASNCAAEFVDASGAVVAEWQWDRYAICDVLTVNGDRFPGLTLQDARAELNALGYVLTEEFPPAEAAQLPPRKIQTFASGAVAILNQGNLEVRVPYGSSGAGTRSAALAFARSVWGPQAALLGPHKGHTTGRDVDGRSVSLRRFDVVIVGSAA